MHTHFLTAFSASALLALSNAAPTTSSSSSYDVSHEYGPDSKCFHYYFDHLNEYKDKYECKDYEQYKGSYDDAYYAKQKAEQDKKDAECKHQDEYFQQHTWGYTSLKNLYEEEKKKYDAVYQQYSYETAKYDEHKKNYEAFKSAREEENRKNEETKKCCEKIFEEVKDYFKPKQSYGNDRYKNSYGGDEDYGKGFGSKKDEECDDDKKDGDYGGKDGSYGGNKDGKYGGEDGKDGHDGRDVYSNGNKHDGKYDDHRGFDNYDGKDNKKYEECDDDKKNFGYGGEKKDDGQKGGDYNKDDHEDSHGYDHDDKKDNKWQWW